MTNRERVLVLLRTRTSWHPSIRSQFASFGAVTGELPTERETCRPCLGLGHVNGRRGVDPCGACDAKGWYLVDAYTRARAPEPASRLSGAERSVWRRGLDAAIASTRAFTDRPPAVHTAADVAGVPPYAWERERDRHYRAGDYHALDVTLGELPAGEARLVVWTFEYEILPPSRAAERALDRLADRMPDPVRVPAWLLPKHPALERRDQRRAAA